MKFAGLYRRGHPHRFMTIAVAAVIGGSLAVPMLTASAPAFAASGPPAPDVLVAPSAPPGPSSHVLYRDDFPGTDPTPGDFTSGGSACLTAASGTLTGGIPACNWTTPDKTGDGALRLTGNNKSEAGFALYQHTLSTGQGADIRFDMYQYKTTTTSAADGISFFLVDGAANPVKPGPSGRALGFAGTKDGPGLQGAIVGIGFDEFGNFSVAGPGATGDGHLG